MVTDLNTFIHFNLTNTALMIGPEDFIDGMPSPGGRHPSKYSEAVKTAAHEELWKALQNDLPDDRLDPRAYKLILIEDIFKARLFLGEVPRDDKWGEVFDILYDEANDELEFILKECETQIHSFIEWKKQHKNK